MPRKTYHSSCDCGRVKIETTFDLSQGTGKCNCTTCMKMRWWTARVAPNDFKFVQGENELTAYDNQHGDWGSTHLPFCKHCGIRLFGYNNLVKIGPPYYTVNLSAIDDLDPHELAAAPVRYLDGLHDNWFSTPEFTKHL